MMQLWTGTPGSGKSLHLAHDVRDNLRLGRKVISTCNINTNMCFMNPIQEILFNISKGKINLSTHDDRSRNFHYVPLEYITPELFYEFAARNHVFGKEHKTIIYLDECVALFSPTVLADDIKLWNRWDKFLRIHRHLGYDIVLVPQSKRLISRKVLAYAETEVKHFNRKYHGWIGLILRFVLRGCFSYSVYWRGDKKAIEQRFFTYKPFYGQMYNSYSMFDAALLPYKAEWEKKTVLLSALCGQLVQIKEGKLNDNNS